MVDELAREAGIPKPKVYIIPDDSPNAFATGRNPEHAAVAATEGIMRLLTPTELKGVLAHELGHVQQPGHPDLHHCRHHGRGHHDPGGHGPVRRHLRLGAGTDEEGPGIMGVLVMSIIAPIAAMLIQMAISRSREYLADETGAHLAHNPESLARALEKLSMGVQRAPMDASPATAHMFIVNPLTGSSLMNLFSTHPPIEERVARLQGHAQLLRLEEKNRFVYKGVICRRQVALHSSRLGTIDTELCKWMGKEYRQWSHGEFVGSC